MKPVASGDFRKVKFMSILRTENITKQYPGCLALDHVNVKFESGKVNALLGKNGSGKSTLVKCFSGAIQPTAGEMYIDDEKLVFQSPIEANAKGFATVYQEMSLVPSLSVTENIFLGKMPMNNHFIDWKKAHAMAKELLDSMGVDIDPKETVSRLPMWQCQVIEITKAMSMHPKVLMLDEPTSSLAASEVQNLFKVIRKLKKLDIIIIYISHKLHEIPEITDTVTVLRDGKYIGTAETKNVSNKDIIDMMFGKVEIRKRPEYVKPSQDIIMKVKGLSRKNKFENINFELYKGEVLGIAGMLGSGRTELLNSIFGADGYDQGEIWINGKRTPKKTSPIIMKNLGVGMTPEDRKKDGLILIHSVQDNLCYASMKKLAHGWFIDKKMRNHATEQQIKDLQIKIPDVNKSVNSLSGGNQQKVVVGNWLNTDPMIMMYDEPSRGIDVNAKQQIFEIMWKQAQKGLSMIFVSSELEELLEVCHRILIMRNGRLIDEVKPEDISINELYAYCMGDSGNEQAKSEKSAS